MLIQEGLDIRRKLEILSDAAKYDVACTSSGVARKGKPGTIGNTSASGICHSFSADGRCISLLKILFTNQCIYDCKYCINRCSNDVVRTSFTPEEVCTLTMEFYRRNYIEGLFLSSGVLYSVDYTMGLIYQTLLRLRMECHFHGYVHVKAIPGADPQLIDQLGFLVDRMSVNLELPTAEGLRQLAPGKTREKILQPMRQVQQRIAAQNQRWLEEGNHHRQPALASGQRGLSSVGGPGQGASVPGMDLGQRAFKFGMANSTAHQGRNVWVPKDGSIGTNFVPAGQSTQMIVGATPENDYQMITVAEALYQKFDLKRVFYSAFVRVNDDSSLPALAGGPPLLREHRLYQADWLLRFYGFRASELLSEQKPNFNILLDPKCDWAIQHLEMFPVEVNRADYGTLLRVPGLGVKSARRIIAARKTAVLGFADLKKLGVVLKRAIYFITCSGKTMYPIKWEQDYITNQIAGVEQRKNWELENQGSYRQLSLFDDCHVNAAPTMVDRQMLLTGQM